MDLERQTKDQVRIIVLLGLLHLLKHSIGNPMLGFDETNNIVTEHFKDDVKYELNTIVSRDKLTAKTYTVIISLCFRKKTQYEKLCFQI